MSIVKCSLITCKHNEEGICSKNVIVLKFYVYDGSTCDSYEQEE